MTDGQTPPKGKPLQGLKVLEVGQLLAGPFASALLAWYGAEVIKIEPPDGDPIRTWRALYEGQSLWWSALGRNKKCVTINLRTPGGQELARQLASRVDVLIENFTPGTMEKWGLGYDDLIRINPRLIMARISGWGQTGPNSRKPGFAAVGEAVGGLRYITGFPDRPPARPNLSIADSLAGIHAMLGILTALYSRDVVGTGKGQMVDVAIYESVFNVLESIVPEYSKLGMVRERSGSTLSGIVPTGTYTTKDGKFMVIAGNSNRIFPRLCQAMGRPDMAVDERFNSNDGRVTHQVEIEKAISDWASLRSAADVQSILERADVPVGLVYSVADMMKDPHFIARGLFETVGLADGSTVQVPTFTPKLSETPGGTEWAAPALGEHNREIFFEWLGVPEKRLQELADEGSILALNASVKVKDSR
jgi:crotonobetainyl-CoA:carnitine CoA-transferase CaiB-like acyl-CoA transferase